MKLKLAVIFGGRSAEHEVSLQSASNIFNAVDREAFEPLLIGVDKSGDWRFNQDYPKEAIDLLKNDYFEGSKSIYILNKSGQIQLIDKYDNAVLAAFDLAFPIIHGTTGEDGTLQGFLKMTDIPFVGPDVLGSAVAMDKDVTKRLLRDAGIPIADFYTLHKYDTCRYSFDEIVSSFGLPFFVKPANAGSSVGVSKVTDEEGFNAAVSEAFKFDNKLLIEEAVIGKEVECAVLGNEQIRASIVGEIVPTKDFYSYDAKYISASGAKLRIPADIDESVATRIRELSIQACKVICCEGMARIDFFLREDNTFVLNEINTLPGFTGISMYPKLWEQTGISCRDLITELVNLSLQRQERRT